MLMLHKLLIGIVLIGIFAVGFTSFISGVAVEYGTNSSEFDEFNETFNKMTEIAQDVETFEDEADFESDSSLADILGSFFSKMYQSARVFKNSFVVMGDMSDSALEKLPAGSNKDYLSVAIGLIILIAISVGIFLHFVTKSERT